MLILALGFLMFFGLIIGAMLTYADASVRSSEQLREQRATAYAADGAIDAAIQVARADTGVGAYGDARCQPPGSSSATPFLLTTTATTSDATVATVTCTWSGILQPDRTVIFTSFVASTAMPIVRAKVTFYDSRRTVMPDVNVVSWTYCGHNPAACP